MPRLPIIPAILLILVGLLWILPAQSRSASVPDLPAALKSPGKMVVLDFYASWCGYCKRAEPEYRQVKNAYSHIATFHRISVDTPAWETYAPRYNIEATPTYLIFTPNGQFIGSSHSLKPIRQTLEEVESR
jgi:thioredoxin:protein disulfide reductase